MSINQGTHFICTTYSRSGIELSHTIFSARQTLASPKILCRKKGKIANVFPTGKFLYTNFPKYLPVLKIQVNWKKRLRHYFWKFTHTFNSPEQYQYCKLRVSILLNSFACARITLLPVFVFVVVALWPLPSRSWPSLLPAIWCQHISLWSYQCQSETYYYFLDSIRMKCEIQMKKITRHYFSNSD